jgi:NAD-reducing hydrogenase small subunit
MAAVNPAGADHAASIVPSAIDSTAIDSTAIDFPAIEYATIVPSESLAAQTQTPSVPGPIRVATAWLGGCSGCHMSLLDLDEALFDLARRIDLVYSPLVDAHEVPDDIDVALIEGAVANEENLELAQALRARSRIVVSFGDCAVNGNVTAMRNPLGDPQAILQRVYVDHVTRDGVVPDQVVPRLLPKVLPLHQVITVDAYLPGCPPPAARIGETLFALLDELEAKQAKESRAEGGAVPVAGPVSRASTQTEGSRHA